MLLYHGTSERHLETILEFGLKPRTCQGNWQQWPSLLGHVYLTNTYPFYFGISATNPDCESERAVALEIDVTQLDPSKFYADEDYVSQFAAARNPRRKLKDLHEWAKRNIEAHRSYWRESLDRLGTCSYKGLVPPSAITRYCLYEWRRPESDSLYTSVRLHYHAHKYQRESQQELLRHMFAQDIAGTEVRQRRLAVAA
jgi:hypothetical protein